MTLSLWLVRRTDEVGYDEYDACVVVAASEIEALNSGPIAGWPKTTAEIVGVALPGAVSGTTILDSFNAG